LEVYGQMAGDSTLAQVRAGLSTIARRLEQAHPDSDEGRGITAVPLSQADASAMLGPVMATLMAFVGLVLIIACANLAGLLLARASARHREIAVRLAVGASRGRLVRQLLVESLLLSVAGGAAGLLVAMSTSRTLSLLVPPSPYPIAFDAHVNPRVVAFTCCATLLTAIVAGLLPAGARSAARFASAADRRR
jgi:ABC-type antimicrobial peptide transport system permease subunit